jgi:hypothetical protein
MNEARFWIGAADELAAGGNSAMADAAQNEANYYLGQAEGALADMEAAAARASRSRGVRGPRARAPGRRGKRA